MDNAAHSSLWAISGLGLWILVLAIPLLVYFLIAAFQRGTPRGGPTDLTLGEEIKDLPEGGPPVDAPSTFESKPGEEKKVS